MHDRKSGKTPSFDVAHVFPVLLCALWVWLVAPGPALAYGGAAGEWSDVFGKPGVNGPVYGLALHEDMLVVGGAFERAGHLEAPCLAGWTGSEWTALGDPEWDAGSGGDCAVHVITILGDLLVAGGRITGGAVSDVITAWDGAAWGELGVLGDPQVSTVKALAVYEDELVAGGFIPPKRYIASYSGGAWNSLGDGMNGEVLALAVLGEDLVAAGKFTEADEKAADHVARWNGSAWAPLGGGLDGDVYALAVQGDLLVAAGDFDGFIAVWNDTSWTSVPAGIPGVVRSLGYCRVGDSDSVLYGAGGDQSSGFVIRSRNASLLEWDVVTLDLDSSVNVIGSSPGDSVIYLGGGFSRIDTLEALHVAVLDYGRFRHLGQQGYGLDYDVEALGTYGQSLVAATWPASVLAWDGSSWQVLAEEADGHIHTMTGYDDYLVVGGAFSRIAGQSFSGVARWNGTSWTQLGAGVGGDVYDLAVWNGDLIAGGSFSQAGGVAADNLAAWDGSSWVEVGGGRGHPVDQVTVWDGKLVVSVRNSIQSWDGTFWRLLGTTYGTIRHLETYGPLLLVAGDFYEIGGIDAKRVVVWDGDAWQPMGVGLEGDTGWPDYWGGVFDVAIYNGNPVAAGYFDSPCSNIARWDGFSWQCIGGLDSSAAALAVWDGGLVIGGAFDVAGDLSSYRLAIWDDFVDPMDSVTAVGRDEAISISWSTPSDPAFRGALVRYAMDGHPQDPSGGLPVPNGNAGRFDGQPGADSSFLHTGLPSDVTYYYSVFAYDHLDHFSSGVFASATTLDKNPPDTVSDFTVTPGIDYLQIGWTNPVTEDFLGTLVRFSTLGYPAHPDSGSPVPNGNDGKFEGLPGSEGSYIHSGVEVARTHYYSAFAYDREMNHAAPVHSQGLVADVFPPELELAVFQNPFLTQYLDIYLFGSEPLDPMSVHIKPGNDSIGVVSVDGRQDLWLGQYKVTGAGGDLTVNGCAADTSSNCVCEAYTFSTGLVSRESGGMVESPDDCLRLTVPPGAATRDAYVMVKLCRAGARLPDAMSLEPDRPGPEPDVGSRYHLSPPGLLEGSTARIEMGYAWLDDAADTAPDRYYIEQVGKGPLESFVDPESRTVAASVSRLGTFRLVLGKSGSSEIVDPRFLRLEPCRPNPFRGGTTVSFRIEAYQRVRLAVYDVEGRLVEELLDRPLDPGTHDLDWAARSDDGHPLPAGIYFLRVSTGHGTRTRKLALIR